MSAATSKFCAFSNGAYGCSSARAQRVSILPGMEVSLCICDKHAAMLTRRANEINEELRSLREKAQAA